MRPMLATQGDRVPTAAGWSHEVKWDGMRVLAETRDHTLRLWSRNENDVTVSFPELPPIAATGRDLLLDAEVVALSDGVPTFGALADRMHVKDAARAERLSAVNPVTLLVFDVLRADGVDLLDRPLRERRAVLEGLGLEEIPGSHGWQVPPAYDDGEMLLDAAERQGLEGIVSKRLSSPYRPGQRSRDWLKFPIRPTGSFVVGGFRPERESPGRLGGLLVGLPTPQGLVLRGRVGSGLAGAGGQRLATMLAPLVRTGSPFAGELPRVDVVGTTWVEPLLVIDVQYLTLTRDRRLRQPAYRGVRSDLTPADLIDAEDS